MRGGKREGAGRKLGTPNKITTQLKEAILEAAHQAGGPGGMVGYLKKQANPQFRIVHVATREGPPSPDRRRQGQSDPTGPQP